MCVRVCDSGGECRRLWVQSANVCSPDEIVMASLFQMLSVEKATSACVCTCRCEGWGTEKGGKINIYK